MSSVMFAMQTVTSWQLGLFVQAGIREKEDRYVYDSFIFLFFQIFFVEENFKIL